jgi:fatty acid desaturase
MGRERLALYSLVGPESDLAVEKGLAGAVWFKSDVPRKRIKELMQREDGPAIRDTAIWLGGIVLLGAAGAWLWTSVSPWLAAPVFLLYGLLYASAGDSRWHEAGHGTAFKTRWMDTAVYEIASFFMMREPTVWRWNHTRHHTDTIIVGRDPEIAAMRPARLARILLNFLGLVDVPASFKLMFIHAFGRLTPDEAEVVPDQEQPKVYRKARIWLAIYAATVLVAVFTGSIVPFLLIGGPRLYATFMHLVYGLTQHSGMGENVLDHRLNTRTIKMCWFNRFMYWNMNYHVEHHMFPMVPYHRLPELHEQIKGDLAPVYPSIWAAYKELVPAVLKQLKDQSYYVRRELPPGAPPYNEPALIG